MNKIFFSAYYSVVVHDSKEDMIDMPENIICNGCEDCFPSDRIKEAVCINAPRIYDSCSDKDCLEDLTVMLTKSGQCIIDKATGVRINNAEVCNVSISLQAVPFHNGFYAVDMTFYFDVSLDAFMAPNALPMPVKGLAVFSKRAVLFGSEGSVKVFSSDNCSENADTLNVPIQSCPKATVQVAEPVPLSARLCERRGPVHLPPCRIPDCIVRRYGGEFVRDEAEKDVLVSIGMFSIVQLERNVQMLIPAYDFCIPHKECVSSSEDPCELFSSIDFPTSAFFPSAPINDCGCGCGHKRDPERKE